MGQRHQVYLAYREYDQAGSSRDFRVIGLHHQWLYGYTAVRQARRMMQFITRVEKYDNPFDEDGARTPARTGRSEDLPSEFLCWHYRMMPEFGYLSSDVYPFTGPRGESAGQCKDPRKGDNNDGITVYDFRNPKAPTYCFLSICGLDANGETGIADLEPIPGAVYLDAYYPPDSIGEDDPEFRAMLDELREGISVFPVTALDALKKIFPAMYEKG
jgi:hypothetical protein